MDVIQYATNIILPRWLKLTVCALLALFVFLYLLIGYFGVVQADVRDGWVQAGAYVLGIVLPILIVALLVLFSQGGVGSLRTRLDHYLRHVLPDVVDLLIDDSDNFERRELLAGRPAKLQKSEQVVVRLAGRPGSCICTYQFDLPPDSLCTFASRLQVSVELNVWKVNIDIWFDKAQLDKAGLIQSDAPLASGPLKNAFAHSVAGALEEGYKINDLLIARTLDGAPHMALVLSRTMPNNFMFDSAWKLYFAQDLMLMLRSFRAECPALFGVKA